MDFFAIKVGENTFTIDVMTAVLFLIIFILCFILYRLQKAPDNFDLRDLIVEKETGRVSLSRFGQLTALIVSTWGFITLTVDGKLSEWYYTSYMMIWAAAEGFRKWGNIELRKKKMEKESNVKSNPTQDIQTCGNPDYYSDQKVGSYSQKNQNSYQDYVELPPPPPLKF